MQAKINKGGTRFAVCTAMAAALVAGFGGHASAGTGGAGSRIEKQIQIGERAVTKTPQNAEARARLAQAYLSAGRFVSAATTFEDAVSLGDKSPGTALGTALAYIGSGRNAEALALLGQWRESIPASDYALALALAGQPAPAVAILTDVIGQGNNTARQRQNLAYTYALDGRWREARVVASQDVPADQLDARLSEWALQGHAEAYQARVATLLDAPVISDSGQPARLALGGGRPAVALAAHDAAPAPVLDQPAGELAPRAGADTRGDIEGSLAADPGSGGSVMARQFVSNPVIQDISYRREARADVPRRNFVARAAPAAATASGHLVQLGAFASPESARRAWAVYVSRDATLKDREMRITEAVVNGRRYWRVAAAGFDAGSARAMCSKARGRGQDCFAYARSRPPQGAVRGRGTEERLAQR